MRIIIGGAGEVGRGLADVLLDEGKVIVMIDNDPLAIREAQMMNALVINGDIKHRKTLEEAGINEANIFIAVTNSDERNIVSCALARHCRSLSENMHENFMAIARINDPETIAEATEGHLSQWAGVRQVFSTISGSIERLRTGLQCTAFEEVVKLGNEAYIIELNLTRNATHLVYTTLAEAEDRVGGLPTIVGINRSSGESIVPTDDTQLLPDDRLAIATIGTGAFQRIVRLTGNEEPDFPKTPRVLIFGANLLGQRLAAAYLSDGCRVTIIEENLELANALAGSPLGDNRLLDVINGEPKDTDLLQDIEVSSHDIALAALDDDHASIALVLLAQDLRVPRTGLILNDDKLVNVVHRMGITFAVARRKVAIDAILTQIHSNLPGPYGLLATIPEIVGMSVPLNENHKFVGKTLKECKLDSWCKVAFIQREVSDNKVVTLSAQSSKQLLPNDRLLVFMPTDRVQTFEKRMGA